MNHLLLFSLLLLSLFSASWKNYQEEEGDLLFQNLNCGKLCDAIFEVTESVNNYHLSHIGMVVKKENSFKVVEAYDGEVKITPMLEFLSRALDPNGQPRIIVGRLKEKHKILIKGAVTNGQALLGKPYDNLFDLNNDRYYCSELIYFIFRSANKGGDFFKIYPMTFKKKGSFEFHPVWQEYFNKLQVAIPEGKPGINPGSISLSHNIEIIHILGEIN